MTYIVQNVDPRYMVNIVSSAITNAPPPKAVANLLANRNKTHHLNAYTDENLMTIFRRNPEGKTNLFNHTTLPARNFCLIAEHAGRDVDVDVDVDVEEAAEAEPSGEETEESKEMRPAHLQTGGTEFPSAGAPLRGTTRPYALDVSIRAEIDPKDPEGRTVGYGFSIPSLEV